MASLGYVANRLINEARRHLSPTELAILAIRSLPCLDYPGVMSMCPVSGREQYLRVIRQYALDAWDTGIYLPEISGLLFLIDPSETISLSEKEALVRFWIISAWRNDNCVNIQATYEDYLETGSPYVSAEDFDELCALCIKDYGTSIMR
jgi:hypothetical protein